MLQTNVEEYFKLKKSIKELNGDIRDAQKNHALAEEIEEASKKLKEARAHLSSDPMITDLKEEVDAMKERFNLIKDIIKQELIDEGQDRVEYDGRVISLVKVMKEGKDEEEEKKGGKKAWDKSAIEIDENVKVQ